MLICNFSFWGSVGYLLRIIIIISLKHSNCVVEFIIIWKYLSHSVFMAFFLLTLNCYVSSLFLQCSRLSIVYYGNGRVVKFFFLFSSKVQSFIWLSTSTFIHIFTFTGSFHGRRASAWQEIYIVTDYSFSHREQNDTNKGRGTGTRLVV